jgi:lipoprotein signal peptidase
MLIVGWLVGPSIITILTSLLLEVIWPYESGMAYLMYSSTNTPVYAFTSILTLLIFVMEIRSLNQSNYLGSEIQSLSP